MRRKTRLERLIDINQSCVGADGYYDEVRPNLWRLDWKAAGFDFCCIYVIGPHKKWPNKIGVSVSPAKRLNGLQTSVWEPLRIHHLFFARTFNDARRVESTVHDELEAKGKALYGEWFDARPNEASDAIEFAALAAGVEISREPFCGLDHPEVQDLRARMSVLRARSAKSIADERVISFTPGS